MLRRIVLAVVVGVAVALACFLVGVVMVATGIDIVSTIGAFLKAWGAVIGLLAAIWWFFTGRV